MIDLALRGETSMEFWTCWTDFPYSNFTGKKPINCSMKTFQAIIGERSNKVCNLKILAK